MEFSRRETLAIMGGAMVFAAMPMQAFAAGDDAVSAFTGGAEIGDTGITLTAPEIAENGNTVPVSVDAPGATEILVLAMGNPDPMVATFKFGELSGSQSASTRIRLAGTQDVVAIAKMADGSFARASATVKVTIGGCGG